jgi:hypothetical protein
VGYGLLAYHPNKVGNVIIAAGSPGGPDALLPPEPVTQSIARIAQNYTAMLPYLFPQGLKDEGECCCGVIGTEKTDRNGVHAGLLNVQGLNIEGKGHLDTQSLHYCIMFTI